MRSCYSSLLPSSVAQPRKAPATHRHSGRASRHLLYCIQGQQPHSTNGSKPQQQVQEDEDPFAAMLWAAQQDGMQVVFEDEVEVVEDQDDIFEDLEDPWMRNPSPPEWSDSPLFTGLGAPNNSSSSTSRASDAAASKPQVSTVNWQQLEQLVQQQEQQQVQPGKPRVVLLEVLCPEGDATSSQQPCRALPDPLPWFGQHLLGESEQRGLQAAHQQHHQARLGPDNVKTVSLQLSSLTREVVAELQQAYMVAVWDSGHHSCLAAAIRLSAVYRLPNVVLLQQQ